METEAIVNTANDHPTVGTGCDHAVYMAAGYDELLSYRKEHIGFVEEGEVFLTPGFRLPAKYIIHAVSPLYIDGEHGEEELLRSCYRKSLRLAKEKGIRSLAFPLISTGGFGYPREEGMRIAVDEIHAFLMNSDMQIYLVVFGEKMTRLGKNLYPDLEAYIDLNYVKEKTEEEYGGVSRASAIRRRRNVPYPEEDFETELNAEPSPYPGADREAMRYSELTIEPSPYPGADSAPVPKCGQQEKSKRKESGTKKAEAPVKHASRVPGSTVSALKPHPDSRGQIFSEKVPAPSMGRIGKSALPEDPEARIEEMERKLSERMKHLSDTFPEYLLYLIKEKGMDNAEVYKRAIVDKKVFSKIKNNPDYHPQKLTALCLCVGARLNLDETRDLLARAGYALSPCSKTDIIFSYFIENEIYDMIDLDIQLEEHGEPSIIA